MMLKMRRVILAVRALIFVISSYSSREAEHSQGSDKEDGRYSEFPLGRHLQTPYADYWESEQQSVGDHVEDTSCKYISLIIKACTG